MDKPKREVIIIRGNDTTFSGNLPITIKIKTDADLTGYTASLTFGSNVRMFTEEEVISKALSIAYTHEETESFFPGRGFALLRFFDPYGRQACVGRLVFNVVFPFDKHGKYSNTIEVVIGGGGEQVEIHYKEQEEELIVDAEVTARGFLLLG